MSSGEGGTPWRIRAEGAVALLATGSESFESLDGGDEFVDDFGHRLFLRGVQGSGVKQGGQRLAKGSGFRSLFLIEEIARGVHGVGNPNDRVHVFSELAKPPEGGGLNCHTEAVRWRGGDFLSDVFNGVILMAKPGR
ncbi:MAG TPA: hypothetical protein VGR78_08640 [Verrucomicrobiae bacterium]|nr:hypothetical protein [Verrucomicrobiae bacterium]